MQLTAGSLCASRPSPRRTKGQSRAWLCEQKNKLHRTFSITDPDIHENLGSAIALLCWRRSHATVGLASLVQCTHDVCRGVKWGSTPANKGLRIIWTSFHELLHLWADRPKSRMRKARRHRAWEASRPRPMKVPWGQPFFLISLVSFGRVCSTDRAVAAAAAVLVETTSSPSHRQGDKSIQVEIDAAGGQIPRHHGGGKETEAGKETGEIMMKLSWAWTGSSCCSCVVTYFVLQPGYTRV